MFSSNFSCLNKTLIPNYFMVWVGWCRYENENNDFPDGDCGGLCESGTALENYIMTKNHETIQKVCEVHTPQMEKCTKKTGTFVPGLSDRLFRSFKIVPCSSKCVFWNLGEISHRNR